MMGAQHMQGLLTEQRNPRSMDLDVLSTAEILQLMNREDQQVPRAVASCIPQIEQCVAWAVEAIRAGGRLITMGAGTSGRLAVLDASECPPTFGVKEDLVIGLIAGGDVALRHAVEGAEDDEEGGARDLQNLPLRSCDLVIALAASGRTPYGIGGLRYAKQSACHTVAITCNPDSAFAAEAELAIEACVGPEILTGSTRLKAGTAQKLILNMISTATMIRLGKCYQNLMVDVQQSNEKLRRRAENMVIEVTGVSREEARRTIDQAGGRVKTAILMLLAKITAEEAEYRLQQHQGHVRTALEDEMK